MRNCSQRVSIGFLCLLCVVSTNAAGKKQKFNHVETKVVVETISCPVRFQVSREVSAGRVVHYREGTPGNVTKTYRVLLRDGKPTGKELVKESRTEPSPTIFLVGKAGHAFSRGDFVRGKTLSLRATGYYSFVCGTGRTRTGERAKYGVVAVDPRVIPLGTKVFVEGYGLALACDTGGAIKGNRIDLCFENRHVADTYDPHYVKVHILH